MSTDLFDQLEKKVSQAVDTIDLLQMELAELRQSHQRLTEERQQWESRLGRIIEQLGSLDAASGGSEQPAAQNMASSPQAQQH